LSITLLIREAKWRKVRGLATRMTRAAEAALREGGGAADAEVTILLAADRELHALNCRFRGKDAPTNVLSFPARDGMAYLGDVAIAYGVSAKEAKAARKPLADHAVHLAVHGVLHLVGYDHETARQAKVMEPMEVRILAALGIADPYGAARP
jgi:probable rRNA maturation factor